jgi:hypothetical protein
VFLKVILVIVSFSLLLWSTSTAYSQYLLK